MRNLLLITFLLCTTTSFAVSKKKTDGKQFNLGFTHLITFTPVSGIVAYSNFNPGAGFDYEYIVSKKLGLGVHIPVMLGYEGPDQSGFNNSYYTRHTCFFTAPGIRFHTGSKRKSIDFSTGPSILIGNMHFKPTNDYYYSNPTSSYIPESYDYNMTGLLVDNSLNFYRNHFAFGFNVKVGTMIERQEDTRFFIQFGMQFGGKF